MIKTLKDNFGRNINYLRVSVTDRCNLKCTYCLPQNFKFKERNELLTLEEIYRIVNVGIKLGIKKIRITGGEPLLRKNIIFLIENISQNKLVSEVSLTTNAILLKKFAFNLKTAGMQRINISLDTLNAQKYFKITKGNLNLVLEGIKKAAKVGLNPIKINVVVMKNINDDELLNFLEFGGKNNLIIRFIEYMPLSKNHNWKNHFLSSQDIFKIIQSKIAHPLSFNQKNEAAKYYQIKNSKDIVGIISPISHGFCSSCNRLRLTADGLLRSCLPQNIEFDLKKIIRKNGSDEEIAKIFKIAVASKPLQGTYKKISNKVMAQIGG